MTSADPFWILHMTLWLGGIGLLTAGFWPWVTRLFARCPDRGAGFAIPGAVFAYLLLMQLLWRTGILTLHPAWCAGSAVAVSAWGWILHTPFAGSDGTRARMRTSLIRHAGLFGLLFLFWALVRSADPGVSHTEQPMDVMWMRASMASDTPPIRDAWFGNAPATYYADGHQMFAFLSLLFGQPASLGVNLAQITWFALTGCLVVSVGGRIGNRRGSRLTGGIALGLVMFVSTPRGVVDTVLRGAETGWWWWSASRPITDSGAELITEFPFFSYWLGDNHAHVIGLPILLLSLFAGLQLSRLRSVGFREVFIAVLAVVWSWRINPWQTPTALALPLLGLLIRSRRVEGLSLLQILSGLLLPLLLLFPGNREGLFQGIKAASGHTNPFEFLMVFGLLVPGVLWGLILKRDRWFIGLSLLALAMFLTCEVVMVTDIYQNRMNTVFKVYYQLWLVIGLLGAAGWAAALKRPSVIRLLALITLVFPASGLFYAARLSGTAIAVENRSLDAWHILPPETRHLLEVANALIESGELIAEAPGDSWNSTHNLISTWTAGVTPLGWAGHQSQWRPDTGLPLSDGVYEAKAADSLIHSMVHPPYQWVWLSPHEQSIYDLHPDWIDWMDAAYLRTVETLSGSLWQIQ